MDIRLGLMTGIDLPIPELQITIHQPTIKEISFIGEKDFFLGVQCLVVNKNILNGQDESLLENMNNFQIFMTMVNDKEMADKKQAVQQVLTLLFPSQKAFITPRSIMLQGDIGCIIDDSNFEILQGYLKEIFCLKGEMASQATGFNPANAAAKKIADKLMRGRQRVAELNGTANASIFSQYLSALTVGLNSMSLQELINLTVYQVYDLIERYQLYISWDIDIRSRLAGAKPDNKPDNWMKNIH